MKTIQLFFYARENGDDLKRLQQSIKSVVPEKNIKTSGSIADLSYNLNHFNSYNALVLLLVVRNNDLDDLLAISDLLANARIILILPDEDKETLDKGLKLYPLFMSNICSDFKDVAGVLEKVLKDSK